MSGVLAILMPLIKMVLGLLIPAIMEKANDTAEDSGSATLLRKRLAKRVLYPHRLRSKRDSSSPTPIIEGS